MSTTSVTTATRLLNSTVAPSSAMIARTVSGLLCTIAIGQAKASLRSVVPIEIPHSIRRAYHRFAQNEAHGVSAAYEAFAIAVANSEFAIEFLAGMPAAKRQPNLLFGAVRHLVGVPDSPEAFEETLRQHARAIRDLMLARSTQTNEPGRCAVLLPVLCSLPQPLALIEVGASAGLCLLPDRYAYDYNGRKVAPIGGQAADTPTFPCQANAATQIPTQVPQIAWRAGLDLNPVDLRIDEEVRWLENLIWPEQESRAKRFRAACRLAIKDPPAIQQGDLLTDIRALAEKAPSEATLVIFHTAVLAYVDRQTRQQFAEEMQGLDAAWISNEAPGVFPTLLERLEHAPPKNRFLLSVDGNPIASTGPHGQSIDTF